MTRDLLFWAVVLTEAVGITGIFFGLYHLYQKPDAKRRRTVKKIRKMLAKERARR